MSLVDQDIKKTYNVHVVNQKGKQMLKIFVCEGEEVLILTNVENMSQKEFNSKVDDCLTEDEQDIINELVYEGVIVEDTNILTSEEVVRECTFEEYIDELKKFCVEYTE